LDQSQKFNLQRSTCIISQIQFFTCIMSQIQFFNSKIQLLQNEPYALCFQFQNLIDQIINKTSYTKRQGVGIATSRFPFDGSKMVKILH
jgi:hypothetical protein